MKKLSVFIVLFLFFYSALEAQTVFDSVLVVTDESAPGANLVSNDSQTLTGIHCHAIKISNESSHDIAVNEARFNARNQHMETRLDMRNIYVTSGTILVGKIDYWSLVNNATFGSLDFYFPDSIVIPKYSSVVINLRSDLYGWGTFVFSLDKLTLTDAQTVEPYPGQYQYWGKNVDGKNIVLANTDHLNLHLGVYPNGWNSIYGDTLYVLPGEYVYSSAYCETNPGNYIARSISAFKSGVIISQNILTFGNFNFSQPWNQILEELGYVTFSSNDLSQTVAWTANSTVNGVDYFNLSWVSGRNNLSLGETANIYFYSEGVLYNQFCTAPVSRNVDHNRVLKSIDGVLGDYDGDGLVLVNDVDDMQQTYTNYGGFINCYVKDGQNAGRAAILFDGSTLSDIFLIRVWINNPNDILVRDLGIGQLMSTRSKPTLAAYSKVVSGNTITINTKAFAVRVSAMLPSGKLWSNSTQVSGNQVVFTVPDQSLKYKIEAVSLPSQVTDVDNSNLPVEFNLSQNYPNPFNPSTTISYSIPTSSFVNLKIYDILGKEVVTLVNEEKIAGTYNVTFNAGQLASGTYLCRLTTGDFTKVQKMILMK